MELNPKLAKLQAHLRQVSEEADYLTSVLQQVIIVQRNLFSAMEQLLTKLQTDYDLLHRVRRSRVRLFWFVGWLVGSHPPTTPTRCVPPCGLLPVFHVAITRP